MISFVHSKADVRAAKIKIIIKIIIKKYVVPIIYTLAKRPIATS